eukprot:TRINITY_DN7349_c0_g1_i1.p1 TRINITY_DN7349_c0_g1~~TRINITY_DN7349_c0_g1_i1.p1  ORF type:complete len:1198 (-),score=191.01 TRINITY_DN7349_c0_g1_i1:203-3742(-)
MHNSTEWNRILTALLFHRQHDDSGDLVGLFHAAATYGYPSSVSFQHAWAMLEAAAGALGRALTGGPAAPAAAADHEAVVLAAFVRLLVQLLRGRRGQPASASLPGPLAQHLAGWLLRALSLPAPSSGSRLDTLRALAYVTAAAPSASSGNSGGEAGRTPQPRSRVPLSPSASSSIAAAPLGSMPSGTPQRIVAELLPLVHVTASADRELQRLAINVLANVCTQDASSQWLQARDLAAVYTALEQLLLNSPLLKELSRHPSTANLVSSVLRTLQLVIAEARTAHEPNLKPLLFALRTAMWCEPMQSASPSAGAALPSASFARGSGSWRSGSRSPVSPSADGRRTPTDTVSATNAPTSSCARAARVVDVDAGHSAERVSTQQPPPLGTGVGAAALQFQQLHVTVPIPQQLQRSSSVPSSPKRVDDDKPTTPRDDSGSDSDGETFQDRYGTWKVRLHALGCLAAIAKCSPKLLFAHWGLLLPPALGSQEPPPASLLAVIISDKSPKVRTAAVGVVTCMLERSKAFLVAAVAPSVPVSHVNTAGRGGPSPFTSFSAHLGGMIVQIHRCLMTSLALETNPHTLLHVLKCVGSMVQNVSYDRFPGLLPDIFARFLDLVSHADAVRCAVLSSTAGLVAGSSAELAVLLSTSPLLDRVIDLLPPVGPEPPPGFQSLIPQDASPPSSECVCLALSVLGNTSVSHFHIFKPIWTRVNRQVLALLVGGTKGDEVVRQSAVVCVVQYLKSLLRHEPGHAASEQLRVVLPRLMPCCFDNSGQLRAHAFTSIANLNVETLRFLLWPELSGWLAALQPASCGDSSPIVRAAACRAMGVLVSFPAVAPSSFLSDSASTLIRAMADSVVAVRIKAAWSLAVWCDVFRHPPPPSQAIDVPHSDVQLQVLQCLTRAALRDNDKVRVSAVRGLGLFGRDFQVASGAVVDDQVSSLVGAISAALRATSVKVCWNGCCAIGNLFRNRSLCALIARSDWLHSVLNLLISLMRQSLNFKVRINAAQALAVSCDRALYPAGSLVHICAAAIDSLDTIEQISHFAQFKYKQTLLDQLVSTLTHCVALLSDTDWSPLQPHAAAALNALHAYLRATPARPVASAADQASAAPPTDDDDDDEAAGGAQHQAHITPPLDVLSTMRLISRYTMKPLQDDQLTNAEHQQQLRDLVDKASRLAVFETAPAGS